MKENRVIKLPIFRTIMNPVARKEWKCALCKERVTLGERYIHYIDRRAHEIIRYRFHADCFTIVEAYCKTKQRTNFTPRTVQRWVMKNFCKPCGKECQLKPCAKMKAIATTLVRKR